MKLFIRRSLLFFVPALIYMSIPSSVLFMSGEYYQLPNWDYSNKKLVGYTYNLNNLLYLKWNHIQQNERHNVMVLGSSRVTQFRSEMFEESFYNVGLMVSHISDFRALLKSIDKEKYPRYLLIGIDQWELNSNFENISNRDWKDKYSYFPHLQVFNDVYSDLFNGKYSISEVVTNSNSQAIGLMATINSAGCRNDGSRFYGRHVDQLLNNDTSLEDYGYRNTFERIDNGSSRFQYFHEINKNAVSEMDSLLDFCDSNNIYVIGYLPPFADAVNKKISNNGNYEALDAIYLTIKPLFDRHNYELYDFTSVTIAGSNDAEFLDGFHGGELNSLKLLIHMVENGSRLGEVTNLDKLKEHAENTVNRLLVYKSNMPAGRKYNGWID